MMSKIYLNRYFPNRLNIIDLKKLPVARITAYYKKYRHFIGKFDHETYADKGNDFAYNGEFGTNITEEFQTYFKDIRSLIEAKKGECNV
jgi:hypothetical protein